MNSDPSAFAPASTTSTPGRRSVFRPHLPSLGHTAGLWLVIAIVFVASRAVSPAFPSFTQATSVMALSLFLVVIAFGQGLVMQVGGIDLSIPGVIAASSTTLALYVENGGQLWLGTVFALGIAAVIGILNGLSVALLKIPAFIATLAIGTIVNSLMVNVTRGRKSPRAPEKLFELFGGATRPFGVPLNAWVALLVIVVGIALDRRTTFGRYVRLLGSSAATAAIAGVPSKRIGILAYAASSFAAGVAAVLLLGFSGNATLSLGNEWLLPSIAAVLLGGTAIGSGRGSYAGTAAGAVLLGLVSIVLSAAGYQTGWTSVLFGGVVLSSLVLTRSGVRFRIRRTKQQGETT